MNKYDDIINLPHHQSTTHPRMSNYDRAAQFSPFAALTGYEDAIEETARVTDAKIELSEDELNELDAAVANICKNITSQPKARITFFREDLLKQGGEYISVCEHVSKIDCHRRVIFLKDGNAILLDNVINITIEE